jgi:hypothetical protein
MQVMLRSVNTSEAKFSVREKLKVEIWRCQLRFVVLTSVHDQSAKMLLQRVLGKFGQFLRHQTRSSLARKLPHGKASTKEQIMVQNIDQVLKKFS